MTEDLDAATRHPQIPQTASAEPAQPTQPSERWLTDAAAGVVLTVGAVVLVGFAAGRLWIPDTNVGTLLSYLAVWVPLLGAVLFACFSHGTRSLVRDFGLRVRPIDLLWGLSIGLLARVVASLIELAVYGHVGSGAAVLGETVHDGWFLFAAVLAPVLLGPFVEELFFRGLLLRAVTATTTARGLSPRSAMGMAIGASALVFALVHLTGVHSANGMLVIGLSTLVFGLGAATVAALTGRLGGALIAHITFNALVVVPALGLV